MEFVQHEIEWTGDKLDRFWKFQNEEFSDDSFWFTHQVGRGILRYVSLHRKIQGTILDYGAGRGHLTERLLNETTATVSACDLSKEAVDHLNKKHDAIKKFAGCELIKALPTSFPTGKFDVVFLIETIEHLTDEFLLPTLGEMRRLVSAKGFVVVTTPHHENLNSQKVMCPDCGCIFHRVQHVRCYSKDQLTSLMETNGFETLDCNALNFENYNEWSIKHLFQRILANVKQKSQPHLIYIGRVR